MGIRGQDRLILAATAFAPTLVASICRTSTLPMQQYCNIPYSSNAPAQAGLRPEDLGVHATFSCLRSTSPTPSLREICSISAGCATHHLSFKSAAAVVPPWSGEASTRLRRCSDPGGGPHEPLDPLLPVFFLLSCSNLLAPLDAHHRSGQSSPCFLM